MQTPRLVKKLSFARFSDILHGNYPLFRVATSRFIAYQAYIFYSILGKIAIVFSFFFLIGVRNFACYTGDFLYNLHKKDGFSVFFRQNGGI